MPECAEVKLMSDFINKFKDKKFSKIEKSPVSKVKTDLSTLDFSEFIVEASSRGKELMLSFTDTTKEIAEQVRMKVTLGMSGNWVFYDPKDPSNEKIHKHVHLRISDSEGYILGLIDVRRFAKWSWGGYDVRRGPCPLQDSTAFADNVTDNIKTHKDFKKPLSEVLMNQRWFNGVGNYLRAEILYRMNVDPFQLASSLSDQEAELLVYRTVKCIQQAYKLGGGQLRDWKNPDGEDPTSFREWIKCYGVLESITDGTGRTFWFDKKWKK